MKVNRKLLQGLSAWVSTIQRQPRAVAVSIVVVTLALLTYAVGHLRINSDNVRLISEDLPSRQNHEAFARLFPNLENALLIVVEGETPELTRAAAEQLAARLSEQHEAFTDVELPGSGRFFDRNSLLYRTTDELYEFADQMARVQPLLAELERDSSIANLASMIERGLAVVGDQPDEIEHWTAVLERVGHATTEVYQEYPLAVSWEELLIRGSPLEVSKRRVIVAQPRLDFENVFAAAEPLALIRGIAADLELTADHGTTVRITGNPALNYEEMVGIAWDIGGAGVFCFALVVGILLLALRSFRLVAAAVAALLVGLVWTAAFAAATIGHLNLVSVTFAILFIGLGVDFGIHLGMRYGDLLREGAENRVAQLGATRNVGGSLVLCTVTTAIGFFVFVPTDYKGVAELGLISGAGMFIILFQTLTLIPALLSSWLAPSPEAFERRALRFEGSISSGLGNHASLIRRIALAAGVGAALLLPSIQFDENVVQMRDPETESVQAFNDLLEQSGLASPWFVNVVTDDLASANAMAARLDAFDSVSQTVTLSSFVPEDQEEKREILSDIAMFLPAPGGDPVQRDSVDTGEQIAALRALAGFLARPGAARGDSPLLDSVRLLRGELQRFLARLEAEGDPEAALAALEAVLLSGLPDQMARLRTALDPESVSLAELPSSLAVRMITPSGHARVQVYPRDALIDGAAFSQFVGDVQSIAPNAAGVAVNLTEFAAATKASFRQALISAVLAIALLLWLLWRRVSDVVLVMAPLLLSSMLTCAVIVLFDISFNFANVIVIPLLLGIGVDSGIHLVHRANQLSNDAGSGALLGTTTARAVFYSALTTAVSFGTLSFSSHRGMASLGIVLTVGMLFTIACNLIVLPALLEWRQGRVDTREATAAASIR